MHGIECGHFHQHIGGRRKLAIYEFQVPERSQKRDAATHHRGPKRPVLVVGVVVLPSAAGSESQRGKEACQPVIDRGAAGTAKIGYPLDHGLILSREGGKHEAGTGPAFLLAIRRAKG